jgi:hypothetical protein
LFFSIFNVRGAVLSFTFAFLASGRLGRFANWTTSLLRWLYYVLFIIDRRSDFRGTATPLRWLILGVVGRERSAALLVDGTMFALAKLWIKER